MSPARRRECDERLAKIAVIEPMPRLIGPDTCGGSDMVQLNAVLLAGGERIALKPAAGAALQLRRISRALAARRSGAASGEAGRTAARGRDLR